MSEQDTRTRSGSGALSAADAIRSARDVVVELTGKPAEGISALNRSDDGGWTVCVDVVELVRVPSSTDLLATYEVCLDADGGLADMERRRRFTRNQVDEE